MPGTELEHHARPVTGLHPNREQGQGASDFGYRERLVALPDHQIAGPERLASTAGEEQQPPVGEHHQVLAAGRHQHRHPVLELRRPAGAELGDPFTIDECAVSGGDDLLDVLA